MVILPITQSGTGKFENIEIYPGADTVKVMMWDNMNNMQPLAISKELVVRSE